jgi:LysM repeat protein
VLYDEVYEAYTNNNWTEYEPPNIKKSAKKSKLANLSSSMSQLSLEKPQTSLRHITQKENETITKIAKTFKLDSSVLLKLNQSTYPTIKKSSKLRKNTKIQLRK